jgi:hypothetical protein
VPSSHSSLSTTVSLHSDGRYAFIEFQNPELATIALALNGHVGGAGLGAELGAGQQQQQQLMMTMVMIGLNAEWGMDACLLPWLARCRCWALRAAAAGHCVCPAGV